MSHDRLCVHDSFMRQITGCFASDTIPQKLKYHLCTWALLIFLGSSTSLHHEREIVGFNNPLNSYFDAHRHLINNIKGIAGRKMCFYSNQACERGTESAMYDYADYAEKLLGITSNIIFPSYIQGAQPSLRLSLPKFQERFPNRVFFCGDDFIPRHLEDPPSPLCPNLSYIAKHIAGCDMIYAQKYGTKEWEPIFPQSFNETIPVAFHAVFIWGEHGNAYAAISEDVAGFDPNKAVVPYMVTRPSAEVLLKTRSWREELTIPAGAFVLCRHGGDTTFNIPYAVDAVVEIIRKYEADKLQFVFLGTPSLLHRLHAHIAGGHHVHTTDTYNYTHVMHSKIKAQVHFLKATTAEEEKERYFKTCDAMLHARQDGETFGLAVAEFSVRNKPVITQAFVGDKAYKTMHIEILKDRGFYYKDKESLVSVVDGLLQNGTGNVTDFDAYVAYSPERVMHKFREVFLDPIFGGG